eukprot:GEMP01054913.1.p1 GENE.GEMP01054913.1~~GEMP01054913.1.p1  ORF type:complete len:168 (+),score=48.20 GEMP01054913.1:139-642(+)
MTSGTPSSRKSCSCDSPASRLSSSSFSSPRLSKRPREHAREESACTADAITRVRNSTISTSFAAARLELGAPSPPSRARLNDTSSPRNPSRTSDASSLGTEDVTSSSSSSDNHLSRCASLSTTDTLPAMAMPVLGEERPLPPRKRRCAVAPGSAAFVDAVAIGIDHL